jgi:small subunit ribosomal protein S9
MFSTSNESQLTYTAIGRRKNATAKVKLVPGNGNISVNNKKGELYFQFNSQYINTLKAPLTALGLEEAYDIKIDTKGGGLRGQTDAIKLGVARALCYMSVEKRPLLKKDGFLTRDYRSKERKKYGLRKARKAPQFSKR